jgi:AraC-like DNA-binding protein
LHVLDVGSDGDRDLPAACRVDAWVPAVPGIAEVLHARLVDYAYPPHCHDTWTVLIVDAGAIRYDLDSRHCGAARQTVAVLPPGVIHDGQAAPGTVGFRKRNLYLDAGFLPAGLIGAAVDHTTIIDPQLRSAIAGVHDVLVADVADVANGGDDVAGDGLDAEGRLALVGERIAAHLGVAAEPATPTDERSLARRLRLLLDEHTVEPITLERAAAQLGRSVPHLVRSFTRQYGVSPHAYVIGRRIERARRQLLRGARPAEVATAVGFYDQAHLTRHFKRHTSTTPARYAASHHR